MRKLGIYIVLILAPVILFSAQVSIYDIQYSNMPGSDGTYASSYRGQYVTTGGIVVTKDLLNGGFYLSENEGGPWKGIYVQDYQFEVRIGDKIVITGEVFESYGFTIIRNLRNLEVVSSGNPLPAPYPVTTGELASSEAYEGVLVQLTNVTVAGVESQKDLRLVNDGSGTCRVNNNLLSSRSEKNIFITNETYSRLIGVVDYRFGEYRLNPRNLEDFVRSPVGAGKPSWGRIKYLYR